MKYDKEKKEIGDTTPPYEGPSLFIDKKKLILDKSETLVRKEKTILEYGIEADFVLTHKELREQFLYVIINGTDKGVMLSDYIIHKTNNASFFSDNPSEIPRAYQEIGFNVQKKCFYIETTTKKKLEGKEKREKRRVYLDHKGQPHPKFAEELTALEENPS